jgi:ABC-2 type transport system permease protein
MLSYIKSELYRLSYKKSVYGLLAASVLFPLLMVCLTVSVQSKEYTNTEFVFRFAWLSYSLLFFIIPVIVGMIFSDEYKDKTLKNAIAYGIPRNTVFFGKLMIEFLCVAVSGILAYTALAISAFSLLPNNGMSNFKILTGSIAGVLPLCLAGLGVSHFLSVITKNTLTHIVSYVILMIAIPNLVMNLSGVLPVLNNVATFLPYIAISKHVWLQPNGLLLCWGLGAVYLLAAGFAGTGLFAKFEIK